MRRLQSVRKRADRAERNLHLVPDPPPRRRPKRRRWKVGRLRKTPYHMNPQLLEYEEKVVLAAVREYERRHPAFDVSVKRLMHHWPGRFHHRYLWYTLVRLTWKGHLLTTHGLGGEWLGYDPSAYGHWGRWWKRPVNVHRPFWTVGRKRG